MHSNIHLCSPRGVMCTACAQQTLHDMPRTSLDTALKADHDDGIMFCLTCLLLGEYFFQAGGICKMLPELLGGLVKHEHQQGGAFFVQIADYQGKCNCCCISCKTTSMFIAGLALLA